MVTGKTCGRLGNFLFQFSAVYGHARKYGFDWCMPAKSMNEKLWPTPWFKNIKYCGPQPGKLIMEKSPLYEPLPPEDNITLEGYWQSEKYWNGFHQEIAEVLEFERKEADYVSVHIRRGDYVTFRNQFPPLPLEYYRKAIDKMKEHGYTYFKIYSDDIKWCQRVFNTDKFKDVQITYSTGKTPINDMRDMYNGEGFIIANSTFSLYPALLRTDNPVVIAPAENRWFGPAAQHLNSPTRMAERFIKL